MRFTPREMQAVQKVLASGWLTTGGVCKSFEKKICEYTGARAAAAVSSCTAGLLLSLKALGIGPGDRVLTTPYTFAATAEAIIHTGAEPLFADIDPVSLNIDLQAAEAKIDDRTRAIMPVHMAGLPCQIDRLEKLAAKHRLRIVHDAAHALGASFRGKKIGVGGDCTCFSFYATKNITCGEGGMVTTDNLLLAEKISLLALHGMDKKAWRRYLDQGNWYYEVVDLGYKFNLPDLNAALGLAMMARLEKLQECRQRIAGWFDRALGGYEELEMTARHPDAEHAWHLYIIKLNLDRLKIDRDQFIRELTGRGIGTSVHFILLFLHRYYRGRYGLLPEHFPHAQSSYQRVISLPFFPDLRHQEVVRIGREIGKIIIKYHRS